jgi:hypothetical protein
MDAFLPSLLPAHCKMVEAVALNAVTKVASSSRSMPDTLSTATPVKALTSRPARKQISHRDLENLRQSNDKANQTGLSYNIWYNKWSGGDREDGSSNKTKATTRVNIARDSGYTRANQQGAAFICLFFARGYCPNGSDCTFLHQLPTDQPDQGHDIFGRGKHGGYRDDMGGVGSIQRVNRTLYVGRITEESDMATRMASVEQQANGGKGWDYTMRKDQMSQTERVLHRHFSEFGELERVRVLHTRGCGFVTFVKEVDAQFGKEAMMNQSLDHDECINLRWATDDPNPIAQQRNKREREEQGMAAIEESMTEEQREAGRQLRELEAAAVDDGEVEDESKRRRIEAPPEMSEEEYQKLLEENERNWAEMEREDEAAQEAAWAALEAQENVEKAQTPKVQPPPTISILDPAALQAIQAIKAQSVKKVAAAPSASALGGLADYGSDSE